MHLIYHSPIPRTVSKEIHVIIFLSFLLCLRDHFQYFARSLRDRHDCTTLTSLIPVHPKWPTHIWGKKRVVLGRFGWLGMDQGHLGVVEPF